MSKCGCMRILGISIAVSFLCLTQVNAAGDPPLALNIKPTPKVMAMAQNPSPAADAKQVASHGQGGVAVKTANGTGDLDAFWVEEIDIDGDGKVEDTQILYDNEDGVLYFYAEDDVPCAGGKTVTAAMLMCVNCKGNADNKPVGSGWVVVMLDAGEAGAQQAGIYGCRFDQNGNPTAFAAATIDERNDDIVIAAAAER